MVFFIHSSPPPFSPPPPPSLLSSPPPPPSSPPYAPLSSPQPSWGGQALPGLRNVLLHVSLGLSYYYVHRVFKGLSLPLLLSLCFIFKGKKMRQHLILRFPVVMNRLSLVGGLWLLLVSTYVVAVIAMLLLSVASIATRPHKLSSIGTMKDIWRNTNSAHHNSTL